MSTCLSCGQPISDPRTDFCLHCGQPLVHEADQPPSPAGEQAGALNVSSSPIGAAAPLPPGSFPAAQPQAAPLSQPGLVPAGQHPGQADRRPRLLVGLGGLVCGPLGILAFFALSWWLYVNTTLPDANESYSASALANPMLGLRTPSIAILLWLIPISGFLLALLGLLQLVGVGSRKGLSLFQLIWAFVGLVTVAGYFVYVQAEIPLGSSDVQISYGPGFWVALLAFVGATVLAVVDLIRPA
ncbi:MAG: hypothetical protein J2P37_27970 [Ktedonobacteraceae bacterium]|nr:hypothetical protein [Ktedonobacteraceae bacterium]